MYLYKSPPSYIFILYFLKLCFYFFAVHASFCFDVYKSGFQRRKMQRYFSLCRLDDSPILLHILFEGSVSFPRETFSGITNVRHAVVAMDEDEKSRGKRLRMESEKLVSNGT